jgi:S-formylglutathione hydrolase FrmB
MRCAGSDRRRCGKAARIRVWIALAVVAAAVGATAVAVARESRERDTEVRSVALKGRIHALVFLPRGYDGTTTRYPTLYFLHGLPASMSAYRSYRWVERALDAAGRPAILVVPQGARSGDTDPEYLDWGNGRNWETFVARELPAYIDAHFRTVANRRGRAILGLSAGGYGATLLGFRHLDRFSVIESWSGYFHATDPTGTRALAAPTGTNAHKLIRELRADERRRPTFFAFYVGRGDARFRAENELLDDELSAAHVPHAFQLYPGAHETAVWQRHARAWLALALAHLAPAS